MISSHNPKGKKLPVDPAAFYVKGRTCAVMISGEEYESFLTLVKKTAILQVPALVLQADYRTVARFPCKLKEIWLEQIRKMSERLAEKESESRKALRRMGGRIIAVKQTPDHREIEAELHGFLYKEKLLNEWIKVECMREAQTLLGEAYGVQSE